MTPLPHRTLAQHQHQHQLQHRNHRSAGPTGFAGKVGLSVVLAVAFAAAVSWASQSSALTAPDTQWSPTASVAAATASGYGVRWIAYVTDPADSGAVVAVTFTLEPPTARTARVQFADGGAWYPCSISAGAARCSTASPRLGFADVAGLTVSATR